jgi:hypothetical protein
MNTRDIKSNESVKFTTVGKKKRTAGQHRETEETTHIEVVLLTSLGSESSNRSSRLAFHCWITCRRASRSCAFLAATSAGVNELPTGPPELGGVNRPPGGAAWSSGVVFMAASVCENKGNRYYNN